MNNLGSYYCCLILLFANVYFVCPYSLPGKLDFILDEVSLTISAAVGSSSKACYIAKACVQPMELSFFPFKDKFSFCHTESWNVQSNRNQTQM
jgi:hypothetical protein